VGKEKKKEKKKKQHIVLGLIVRNKEVAK